ncbi:MAG: PGF-pre-PGF domain-containing protein, partial [Candidatus Nanoarchaeia archaeon]
KIRTRTKAYDGTNYSTTEKETNTTINASAVIPPNNPPILVSARINPETAHINATLTGYCNASDSDGNNLIYNYIWYLNNQINTTGTLEGIPPGQETNISEIPNTQIQRNQNWTLNCQANDSTNTSSWLNSTTVNIQSFAPTAPTNLTLSPNNPEVGDTLTATADGSTDEDNDTIEYYYEFYNNDDTETLQSYSTNNEYETQEIDSGDTIRIRSKAYDGLYYSSTIEETTTIDSSSGGGGGGGGGGGSSAASTDSTIKKTFTQVKNSQEETFPLLENTSSIIQIKFTPNKNISNVILSYKKLKQQPTTNKNLTELTYTYFEITTQNLAEADIQNAEIKFKINKTWLQQKNLTTKEIIMYRYNQETWKELTTTYINSDSTYHYFNANTPGFSYFAISTKKETPPSKNNETANTTTNRTTNNTITPTIETPQTIPLQNTPPEKTKTNPKKIMFIAATILILSSVSAALIINHKKKKTQKKQEKEKEPKKEKTKQNLTEIKEKEPLDEYEEAIQKGQEYIQQCLQTGNTPEQIQNSLTKAGWQEQQVKKMLEQAQNKK